MTALPAPEEKAAFVNRMFADIAPRYDLMNRLMTAGQDVRWRREVVQHCRLPLHGVLLDVGTGTGDIAHEATHHHPTVRAVGCDFTYSMLALGQQKSSGGSRIDFTQGDALSLPFPGNVFDAVTSGFLLRNVTDIDAALAEQARVAKSGGRVICLETTPPRKGPTEPLVRLHMFKIIPLLGRLLSPRGSAYTYLPTSTTVFPGPDELTQRMARVGLKHVQYHLRMFGTVAVHVGIA